MADLAAEIQRWAYIISTSGRTVFCHPTREAELRGALHEAGFSQGVQVVPTPVCPEGQFMVARGPITGDTGAPPPPPPTV